MAMTRRPRIEASLILLLSASAASCGDREPGTAEDPLRAPQVSPGLAEAVLQNASYRGILEGPVNLSDGRFEGEPFEPGSAVRPVVTLVPGVMATGDLDGEPGEEAVVALAHTAGGTGVFMYLAIVRDRGGEPENTATIGLGDRVRITALELDDGTLAADLVEHGPDDPMCCPTQAARREWRFDDGELVPADPARAEQGARFRGHLVWGHESRSFTECGSGREGWVINDAGAELVAVYEELTHGPYQPMFVEVRGEWVGAPAEGFGADFEEALRVTELVRAEGEGFGCRLDLTDVLFAARGNEPSWSLQVREDGLSMRRMDSPDGIVFPPPQTESQPALIAYESETAQSKIRVILERRRCVDTMSGARYGWTARVDLDGMQLEGCAAEGI